MKLVTFGSPGRAGVVGADGTIVAARQLVPDAPDDVLGIIDAGPRLWRRLGEAARSARGGLALAQTRLAAPIPRLRRNAIAVGWNYLDHFRESKSTHGRDEMPPFPVVFTKSAAAVVGPDGDVWHPAPYSDQLDWEAELAVVVGKRGRDVPEERAMELVFGYTVANDVSVRDIQRTGYGGQFFKGKSFDTHLPLGPWIVTADELGDPHALRITSRVNGVTKQDGNTGQMAFRVARLVAEFSKGMALEPGDVILTGTPKGVGDARVPPEYLKVGDVMEMEIERIGVLRNRITPRPAS